MNTLTSFWSSGEDEYNPDRLGRIKVLLVGPQGCGKTSLAHLLTNYAPLSHSKPTVGCTVSLVVMKYPLERAKQFPSLAGQEYFLELWDVGAHPRYEAMRGLFYQGVNGVILLHDLTFSRSLASLQRWASEVARLGSFQAPLSEDRAQFNLGALPVPCLVVGNKLDLVPRHKARYSRSLGEQLWATLQRPLSCFKRWAEAAFAGRAVHEGSLSRASSGDSVRGAAGACGALGAGAAPREALLHGNLQAAVARGDLDMHAVTSFFCTLIERRYCPSCPALAECLAPGMPTAAKCDHGAAAAPAGRALGDFSVAAAASAAAPHLLTTARLSGERLPPVMYNAISEESSPYSSFNHTPFSSSASLARAPGGSGNLGSWLQPPPAQLAPLQQQQGQGQRPQLPPLPPPAQPVQFPGVSVALRLQAAAGALQAQLGAGGGGKSGPFGGPRGAPGSGAGLGRIDDALH